MMSRVNDKEITAEEYAVLREAYHNVIVGAPLSDKAKNNMSISRLKYYEDQANRDKVSEYMKAYAATISEEERKMKYNTRGRKVRCVETNEIFNTVTEAQKAKHCSVLSALKGVYETSGGYHWEYLDNKNYDYSKRYKKVRCIETGEVFESILEANKKYKGKIGGCCRGQRKTAAGYH